MQRVFVLDSQKRPLMPCHPARARQLLDRGKAAVFRRVPFTLILKGQRPSLRDAAAVNATRHAMGRALQALGLPTTFWSGGRTKKNRSDQGYAKDHWIDAACVGEAGSAVRIPRALRPLIVQAKGRGSRQMCRVDKYGFPRSRAKAVKRVHDLQTGDLVRLNQPGGKYAGSHVGRVAVRERGDFDVQTLINGARTKITAPWHRFTLIQRDDGYHYA
ncbi:RRXRR domain-containing protein [Thiolapillus sp.]